MRDFFVFTAEPTSETHTGTIDHTRTLTNNYEFH